jgi:DNA-binding response OmpR family regulator
MVLEASNSGDPLRRLPGERSADVPRRPLALVAEDDPDFRALVSETLLRHGFDVIEAANGRDLAARIDEIRFGDPGAPHVIVTDIRLPGRTATDVLLRTDPLDVPLVLMTGFPDDDVRKQARSLGAVLLAKPFPLDRLVATVRAALARGT